MEYFSPLSKIIVSFETIINYYFDMPDSLTSTDAPLLLQDFLPYRLAVLAKLVGAAFSQAYGERFGISNPQWRVLFALGRNPIVRPHVVQHAALDKVQVSRAVAGLIQMGLSGAANRYHGPSEFGPEHDRKSVGRFMIKSCPRL